MVTTVEGAHEHRRASIGDQRPAGLLVDDVEARLPPWQDGNSRPVPAPVSCLLEFTGRGQTPANTRIDKTLISTGNPGMPGCASIRREVVKQEGGETACGTADYLRDDGLSLDGKGSTNGETLIECPSTVMVSMWSDCPRV